MQDIVTAIQRVTDTMAEISTSAAEQSDGISQVNQAVAHLDGITQQNAAAVEEIAAASMSLAQRAKVVSASVQVFKLDSNATTTHV